MATQEEYESGDMALDDLLEARERCKDLRARLEVVVMILVADLIHWHHLGPRDPIAQQQRSYLKELAKRMGLWPEVKACLDKRRGEALGS